MNKRKTYSMAIRVAVGSMKMVLFAARQLNKTF